jgi:long-subunit acyl-CoA synthetase (AMP-forming)
MTLPSWVHGEARVAAAAGDESATPLSERVGALAGALLRRDPRGPVGLLADNSPHWVALDLASHVAGVTLVPLPEFFTQAQLEHAVRDAGMQSLFCGDSQRAARLGFARELSVPGALRCFERTAAPGVEAPSPAAAHKISFTSGSTGTPKGVRLTADQQLLTARALALATAGLEIRRHLNLLPLPVLLENVAGVYAPLLIGAECICPPLAEVGLTGATGFVAGRCMAAIARHRPQSAIVLPQMLRALVNEVERVPETARALDSLRLLAVGGAAAPAGLVARARALGLPVYEGYGLTECASVVTLNLPGADRVGSVGRPLPGARIMIAAGGEIQVAGRGFAGYLGPGRASDASWFDTGDLGSIDAEGFLWVAGRKDSLVVTGYGRNVSPEWPESVLLGSPAIAQTAVFGHGRPHLAAVLVPAGPDVADAALHAAVRRANSCLPDYARIGAWLRASEPFRADNGLATANGRVRRHAVWSLYQDSLNRLYETTGEPS